MEKSNFSLNKLGTIAISLALISFILDAPIRYLLSSAKIESSLYIRDITLFLTISANLIGWTAGKWKSNILIPTYIIGIHFLWGLINLPSITQPIVALKIYIAFLAGMACYQTYINNEDRAIKLISVFYAITALGVVIDFLFDMPWAGATFSSAVGEVTVSREWTSGGMSRTAGFGRSSTETAAFLAILAAPILVNSRLTPLKCIAFYLLNLALISATTTKGAILAWIVIGVCTPFIRKQTSQTPTMVSIGLACAGTALPILIYLYDYRINVNDQLWWLLSSFADRINRMWPEAVYNIHQHGNAILGRGLGGIGFPQLFGEGKLYNAADNVMLYIYVTFGVPGIIYVLNILLSFKNKIKIPSNVKSGPIFSVWLVYWFTYGLVGNNIDSAILLFTAGLITAYAKNGEPREK